MADYAAVFAKEEVDLTVLPDLTDDDLRKLGIPLGHRKKLLKAIATLNARDKPDGADPDLAVVDSMPERRQLTVMFCDLVGSTTLSERFDPEDLREIIVAYQRCCEQVIQRFDGYVARYMGDGLLVYFGFPRAHEDDAARALRAGLEIVAAVGALQLRPELVLRTRVGIATGEVVVGDLIGEGMARESAVIGSTPHLAARLQSLAEPDSVVIAASTRRLTERLFDHVVDLGRHPLEGFEQPVQAWRVVADRRIESRGESVHATRLIGRERELDVLRSCWRKAETGEGRVVMITGEPGIGKSRLFQVLRRELTDRPHALLRYYGVRHFRNSALRPVIDQLERAARLNAGDSPAGKLDKLEAMLARAVDDVQRVAPLFAALLSLPTEGRYPPPPTDARQLKERITAALLEQLNGLATRQPVLMLFEDLHWIDPTTLELLQRTVERVRSLPMLLVLTHRPEFSPPWSALPHFDTLQLDRLPRNKIVEMLYALTGGKALPKPVLEQLVTRTDGVPLFIEELTTNVLEAGFLRDAGDRYALDAPLPALAVPDTLQDALMGRLDRLGAAKKIAQAGAVIGRMFSAELLAAVVPFSDRSLRDGLERLLAAELILRRETASETLYVFKHALIQDTAYNSLLRDTRKALHAGVARALEAWFPETVATHPELLARHYTRAGRIEQAIPYWLRAGRRAAELSANPDALAHLDTGLTLLRKLPPSPEQRHRELDMEVLRAGALRATKGIAAPETGHAYERVQQLCHELDETRALWPTLNGLYSYHLVRAEYGQALDTARQLLARARARAEIDHAMIGHRAVGATLLHMGRIRPARRYLEQALESYDPARHGALASVYGTDHAAITTSFLAMSYWLLGRPDRAVAIQENALQHARELGHAHSIAQVLTHLCLIRLLRRDYAIARRTARQLLAFTEEHSLLSMAVTARLWLQWVDAISAPDTASVRRLQQAARDWWATGAGNYRPLLLTVIAEIQGRVESPAAGLDVLAEAEDWMQRNGECWAAAELYRVRGVLSAAEPATAEAYLNRALATTRARGAVMWGLRAAVDLAGLRRDQGRRDEARELLVSALDRVADGAASVDVATARALLARLATD